MGTFYHPWEVAHDPAAASLGGLAEFVLSQKQESAAVSDQGISGITRPHTKISYNFALCPRTDTLKSAFCSYFLHLTFHGDSSGAAL